MTPAQRKAAALSLAVALAVPAEGIRRIWYPDTGGIITVCYGHTGPVIDKQKVYSLNECKALLTKDMLYAVQTVDACRPGLPINVLAAFSDSVYNLGPTIACNKAESAAARLLAAGDYTAACNQLPRWNKGRVLGVLVPLPGLTKRREMERQVCLDGLN